VTVTFPSGSFALDAAAEQRLDAYAACIASERARVVYVSGTTDPAGSDEDNLVLARARGRSVADYLHGAGLHADFEIHATGEAGAIPSRQVWPLERAATVSDVRPR
jgi:outer membrane protein OmpA-like peptidoglycan-associated protein